jgi:hypothetical protein
MTPIIKNQPKKKDKHKVPGFRPISERVGVELERRFLFIWWSRFNKQYFR